MEKNEEDIKYLKGKTLEEGEWSEIVVIHPNGEYEAYDCENSLDNMQALVGGLVQVVPYFERFGKIPCTVLCDEEGKLKGYPYNNRATLEWGRAPNRNGGDWLVGAVVVLTGNARRKWS